MAIDLRTVESLAPDQASLNAATKLRKPAKWPLREKEAEGRLVWGECQGSGSNPYRVMFDQDDHGYKCTCPSRKFPCKHVLALMWMFADAEDDFGEGSVPDWVTDWVGRRRKTSATPAKKAAATKGESKSLTQANVVEEESPKPVDPEKQKRLEKAAATRAAQTQQMILDSLGEFENWIADQLRLGLAGFLEEHTARCRRIAARLVDGRAAMLASRVDELPSKLSSLPREEQLDATIQEFSKFLVLSRAFRANPEAPDVRAAVATAMKRDDLLEHKDAEVAEGVWEVVAALFKTQRDGLIRQSTWLMRIEPEPIRFALLLDFFPVGGGYKSSAGFTPGDQFEASIRFHPANRPLRAIIEERKSTRSQDARQGWPSWDSEAPLTAWMNWFEANPWGEAHPILLSPGRIGRAPRQGRFWWQASDESAALPLATEPHAALLGCELPQSVALWDGQQGQLLAASTEFGTCHLS